MEKPDLTESEIRSAEERQKLLRILQSAQAKLRTKLRGSPRDTAKDRLLYETYTNEARALETLYLDVANSSVSDAPVGRLIVDEKIREMFIRKGLETVSKICALSLQELKRECENSHVKLPFVIEKLHEAYHADNPKLAHVPNSVFNLFR